MSPSGLRAIEQAVTDWAALDEVDAGAALQRG